MSGQYVHRVLELPGLKQIRVTNVASIIWDLSSRGRWIFHVGQPAFPRSIAVTDTSSGAATTILVDPDSSLYLANLSPDGKWIVFTSESADHAAQMFAAPFRGAEFVPRREWIPLGAGDYPRWSPSANRVYFLDHDETRILTQALNPVTKMPVGPPQQVFQVTGDATIKELWAGTFRIAAARDKIVFPLARRQSWIELLP